LSITEAFSEVPSLKTEGFRAGGYDAVAPANSFVNKLINIMVGRDIEGFQIFVKEHLSLQQKRIK
jgi:hypothetical protein